jgi:peptidoglycan/LPS O-acetylase OafA/YrhL
MRIDTIFSISLKDKELMYRKQYIEILDFLKGYAMLSIVVFHLFQKMDLPDTLLKVINFGGAGVHTFIFISGFGLYLSHLKHPLTFVEYLKKRFLKVYIPYIITVSLLGIIGYLIPFDPYNTWAKYFSHVFLYKMFSETYIGTFGYHFWFISLIFELYLVFPLLIIVKQRLGNKWFLSLGIIISLSWSFLVLILGKAEMRVWNSFFLQYLWEFILGMYFAGNIFSGGFVFWDMKKSYVIIAAGAGMILYVLFSVKLGFVGKMLNDIPSLIGFTYFGILLYRLNIKLVKHFFVFTGVISFALYLVHFAIKLLVIYELEQVRLQYNIAWLVIVLGLCFIIAYFYDKGIKKFYEVIHY